MPAALAILAAFALGAAPVPIVAVIDLPAPATPEESAPLPPEPVEPVVPVAPDSAGGDETAWAAFREAQAAYESAREQAQAMAAARREAERAARDAARARVRADRYAAALTTSVEQALRRTGVFEVRTARAVRVAAGEAIESLRECEPAGCLLGLAALAEVAYVVTLRAEVGAPEIEVTLVELRRAASPTPTDAPPAPEPVVLGEGSVPVGGSARDLIPHLFVRAMATELERCCAHAERAAAGLAWGDALDWLGRCLRIDSNHGPALFLAGRAFFEQGDLRGAEKRLRQAILQEEEVGEASHLLALIALRKRRETAAAGLFEAAIASGRDSFEARLLLGRLASGRDAAAAVEHLERAVTMRPNHGEASFLLGMLFSLGGQAEPARRYLEIAVAADHRAGDAHFEIGALARQAGDDGRAVSHLEAAREFGRTTAEVLLYVGRHHVISDPAHAVVILAEARRKGARAEDLDFNLGRAALAAGETAIGLAALKRALGQEAHAADARLLLAQAYVELGNIPVAASHYGPAIRMGRDSYAARVVIAEAAGLRGDAEQALEHYLAALAHRPGDGRASYGAALVLLGEKEVAAAVPHLERAVAAGHRVAEGHARLGRAVRSLGDREASLTHFAAAAAAGSDEPMVFRALARASDRGGDIDGAVELWGRVLALVPGDAEASFRRGKLRFLQARPEAAQPLLEHAAKSRAYEGRAHRLLARIARARRDPVRALFHYEAAVKIEAADFELFANAGWAALEAGRDDRARYFLARALAFRPGDGKIGFALGGIDLRAGRHREARAFFRVALAAGVRVAEAERYLGDIAAEMTPADVD